jgi:hypothetical protein
MSVDFRTVYVRTANDTWHICTQNMDSGTVLSAEGCNLDDSQNLEMYPELPEEVRAEYLCKRCYPTVSDR